MEYHQSLVLCLKQSMNEEERKYFLDYTLTEKDRSFIKETAQEVLQKMPYKEFNCAAMSAMWCAIIEDHSEIPVVALSGSLVFGNRTLFSGQKPIPSSDKPVTIKEVWDGHCWLFFGGLVADISLSRTVALGNVPKEFADHWSTIFGKTTGLVCASPEQLYAINIYYAPKFRLTNGQINGLLNGIQ